MPPVPSQTSTSYAQPDDLPRVTETFEPPTPESRVETVIVTNEPLPEKNQMVCEENFCTQAWTGWLERPIGAGNTRIIDRSYPYGSKGDGDLELHYGVEFLNQHGTPVLAAQAGEVVFAGTDDAVKLGAYYAFYGNVVVLEHPGLMGDERTAFTLYAHLSEIDVVMGEQVAVGDVIGRVGATGGAFGPHLHFEVRVDANKNANTVNPVLWFAPLDDENYPQTALLAGLILDQNGNPIPQLPFTLEKLSASGEVEMYFYPMTYFPADLNAHPLLNENFTVPDIPAGKYRLALIAGKYYEYFFKLEPGAVGFITVQLD